MLNILIWIISTKDTTRFFLIDWPLRSKNPNLKKRTKFSRPCLSNIWMVFQLMMKLSVIPILFLSSTIKSTSEDFLSKELKLPTLSWKVPEYSNNTDFRITIKIHVWQASDVIIMTSRIKLNVFVLFMQFIWLSPLHIYILRYWFIFFRRV